MGEIIIEFNGFVVSSEGNTDVLHYLYINTSLAFSLVYVGRNCKKVMFKSWNHVHWDFELNGSFSNINWGKKWAETC